MNIFPKKSESISFPQITIPSATTIEEIVSKFNDLDGIDDYRNLLVILLSAIANQDNALTISEVRAYENAIIACVDDEYISDPINRLRLFSSLLSPINFSDDLIKRFLDAVEKNAISNRRCYDIANALVSMLEGGSLLSASTNADFVKKMILSLNVPTSKFFARLDTLQEQSKEAGIDLVKPSLTTSILPQVKDFFADISIKKWQKEPLQGLGEVGTIRGILNEKATRKTRAVKVFGKEIGDTKLATQARDMFSKVKHGAFKIVLCGEMKHGKSSIFNLLVGDQISPVDESVATTAASIELFYSPQPVYQGEWVCAADIEKINDYFEGNKSDYIASLEQEKILSITKNPEFKPGGTFESIGSKPEMIEYSTTRGNSAILVRKVSVGLPLPYLKKGTVIIDTPGLNDIFHLRERITLEDSKQAHCIVFVMRADKFGTNSEKDFLVNFLREGAMKLVLVITHIDCLSNKEPVNKLIDDARHWLESVIKEANSGTSLADIEIFGFDARFNAEDRASIRDRGYSEFTQHLKTIARQLHSSGDYEEWVNDQLDQLDRGLQKYADTYLKKVNQILQQENELSGLTSVKNILEKITQTYGTDTASRLNEYRERLKLDYDEISKGLVNTTRLMIQSLNGAVEKKMVELGDDYDLDRKWDSFDKYDCQIICEKEIKEFQSLINNKVEFWNSTFKTFSKEEHERLHCQSMEVINSQESFSNLCATATTKERVFNSLDRGINRMKDAALVLTGAITGATGAAPISVLSGIAVLLSSSWMLPTLGLSAAAILGLKKMIGSPDERKRTFREHKIDHARDFIETQMKVIKTKLAEDIYQIDKYLCLIGERHSYPVLTDAYASLKEIDLRLKLIERINDNEREIVNARITQIRAIS